MVGARGDASAQSALVKNKDYWELPPIPKGTFKKEKAYVLALTGCVGDTEISNKDKCGPGFDATSTDPSPGNLKVTIFETTRTPVSATAQGVQFLHAAAPAAAVLAAFPGGPTTVSPGFVSNPGDGGNFKAATGAGVALGAITPAQAVTGVKDSDYFALGQTNPLSPPQAFLPFSLPQIQAFSGLGLPTAPTVYVDGKNYVYIAVGDPQESAFSHVDGGGPGDGGDGSKFNTKFFHFLAFPTDPDVITYKP
jgi:hypothetical protein